MMTTGCGSSRAPFVGALDDYTSGLVGLWSVSRRLLTSWTSPLIRVRRSGDDAESDFSAHATTGILDVSALEAWVIAGGGTEHGYVTTLYDQNGSGIDFIQTSASAQRRIVNAGSVETLDGLPAMASTSTSQGYYTNTFVSAITTNKLSVFIRGLLPTVGLTDEVRYLSAAGNTGPDYAYPNIIILGKNYNVTGLSAYANGVMGPTAQTFDVSFVASTILDGTNCVITNGGGSSSTAQTLSYVFDRLFLGMQQAGVFFSYTGGKWDSGALYSTDQTANDSAIRTALTV